MKAISATTATRGPLPSGADPAARLLTGLAPVWRADARVLVLGSLPGAQSLARQRYYANPRNQFWHLVGRVIGTNLPDLDYAERLDCLIEHRIALWDAVAAGHRRGSLDSALRISERNDLDGLVARLPRLRVLAFNGATAARAAAQACGAVTRIVLPSSSPANTMALAHKQDQWNAIAPYLAED